MGSEVTGEASSVTITGMLLNESALASPIIELPGWKLAMTAVTDTRALKLGCK